MTIADDHRRELASRYLDDEVTPDERAQVEADPDLTALVGELGQGRAFLRSLDPVDVTAPPAQVDRHLAAALDLFDSQPVATPPTIPSARAVGRTPWWQRFLPAPGFVLAGMALVALGFGFVQILGSGGADDSFDTAAADDASDSAEEAPQAELSEADRAEPATTEAMGGGSDDSEEAETLTDSAMDDEAMEEDADDSDDAMEDDAMSDEAMEESDAGGDPAAATGATDLLPLLDAFEIGTIDDFTALRDETVETFLTGPPADSFAVPSCPVEPLLLEPDDLGVAWRPGLVDGRAAEVILVDRDGFLLAALVAVDDCSLLAADPGLPPAES